MVACVHHAQILNGLGEQHLCKVMYKRLGVQLELDD